MPVFKKGVLIGLHAFFWHESWLAGRSCYSISLIGAFVGHTDWTLALETYYADWTSARYGLWTPVFFGHKFVFLEVQIRAPPSDPSLSPGRFHLQEVKALTRPSRVGRMSAFSFASFII